MKSGTDRSWFTLRFRALIALGAVAVLLPGVGGSIGIAQARSALVRQVERGQLATARSLASEIEHSITFGIDFVRGAARRPGLSAAVASQNATAARAVLVNIVDTTTLLRAAAVYVAPGRVLSVYPVPLASSAPDLAAAPTSRLFPAMPRGDDAIMAVREPFLVDGKTVGFIIGEISFVQATPVVSALRFGRSGTATIVDRDARVLTSGEPRRIGGTLTASELQPLIEGLRQGTAHYFGALVGRREIAAFAPVSRFPWGVLVTDAESEALGPISHSVRVLLIGLIAMIVVGAVITYLVVQAFDRYERRLSERLHEQERLNRALEGFSRHVAHDLRTPIAVIQLAAQTVDRESASLTEGARKAAGMIDRQAQRASELIEDLLDLARASGTPKLEEFDLEQIVDEAARDVQALDLRVERPLPHVTADRATVRQAIANLLQNASRYARVNGVAKVSISGREDESGWTIAVADEGPGLPEGGDQQMFEPFTRGAARTSEHGSGLGLAIVAATAQAHGGRAWYEPRPGGGSVFSVSISRHEATARRA